LAGRRRPGDRVRLATGAPSARSRRLDRVKRQMLREAVAENLETIEGVVARPRLRTSTSSWLGWSLLAAVAVSLVATLKPTSAGRGTPQPDEFVGAGIPTRPGATEADSAAPPGLAAPRAIDPALFRLAVRRVVIDPGHGGSDPGAMMRGMREKEITLDIARRLAALLRADAFDVVMTREGDETLTLQQRVQAANAASGDVFLSIHVNSIPTPLRRGVETYVLGPTTDPHVERLAGAENFGSGYSLADFRRLLEGVYVDVRHDESRRFAQAVQGKMFATLRRANPALQDRSVKQAPFVVLVGTEMPGVLSEVSCISNDEDARLLKQSQYRQGIAEALAGGVRAYAAARGLDATVAQRGPGAM
jgi:N-acetylmuramoyl-L-alanine amidase